MQTANLFCSARRNSNDTWRIYAQDALEESTFEDVIRMMEGSAYQAQTDLSVEIPMKLESTSTSEQSEANSVPRHECSVNHHMRMRRRHYYKHPAEATMTRPLQQIAGEKNILKEKAWKLKADKYDLKGKVWCDRCGRSLRRDCLARHRKSLKCIQFANLGVISSCKPERLTCLARNQLVDGE